MPHPEDHLVPVHRGESQAEAELIRLVLEDAGVMAIVPDENTPLPGLGLTPQDGQYSGLGCDVLVPSRDLERARQVLAEARDAGRLAAAEAEKASGETGEARDEDSAGEGAEDER